MTTIIPDTDEHKEMTNETTTEMTMIEKLKVDLLRRKKQHRDWNQPNQYDKYFNLLNDTIKGNEIEENLEEYCCGDKQILEDGVYDIRVCGNCGMVFDRPDDDITFACVRNPKYKLSSQMSFIPGNKYKALYRLHKWNNYDYKENTANTTYTEIEKIGKKLSLNTLIIANACNLYKTIYIDSNISCRNRIKICMYLYCLYKAARHSGRRIKIFNILKATKIDGKSLTVDNFNKATEKLENKLLLNDKMVETYAMMYVHYDDIPSMDDFIDKYNEIFARLQKDTKRLNKNTALLLAVYKLLEITDKKRFLKLFSISEGTLNKFLKILA